MHNVKATNSATLRKHLQKQDPQLETQFKKLLSPETLTVYETAFTSAWISTATEKEIMEAAVKLLFPDAKRPLFELGCLLAQQTLNGIYKVFFRMSSIASTLNRAEMLFRRFNNNGKVKTTFTSKNSALSIITDAEEMLPFQFEIISGYIKVGLELSGGKNVSVACDFSDPQHFKWLMQWA